jgi:hypothetical protein
MGEFTKWLLHEDQKELFDYLFAIVLNVVLVVVTALLLWPFGKAGLAWRLTKGYWVFWTVLIVTSSLMVLAQRVFRMDLYSRGNGYIISALILSGFLQVGWSAYAAPVIRSSMADASIVVAIIVYCVGVVSAYVAAVMVGAYYTGGLYRMVNSALAILTFILFSIWPTAGLAIYGWFFTLVGKIY